MNQPGLTSGMLSRSQLMDIALAAQLRVPVLVSGDTGARRRGCARVIHDACVRERRPFVAVSCDTHPAQYDGHWDPVADRTSAGCATSLRTWLEKAKGGTLFIDDLHHMSPVLQQRLVAVLDLALTRDREPSRAVRFITGAKPGWPAARDRSHFSESLFYRLNVMRVDCTPVPHSFQETWRQDQGSLPQRPPGDERPGITSLRRV